MDLTSIWSLVANGAGTAALTVTALTAAWYSWGTTKPNERTIIDSFGEVKRIVEPGLFLKLPWQTATPVRVDSQIESEPLNVVTKDTNGTKLPVTIFWKVESPVDYQFGINDSRGQMREVIHEAVRKTCSGMHSDDLFTDREKIRTEILSDPQIQAELKRVGISIDNIVIAEPLLPANVIKAKNDIRQAELDKAVAREQAEALRIRIIEEAKAKMEARDLEGQGAEKFRTNILRGLAEQAKVISDTSGGRITMDHAMNHITELYRLGVQETAAASHNKVFFMPTEGRSGVSFTKADLIASLDAAHEQNNAPAARDDYGPAATL